MTDPAVTPTEELPTPSIQDGAVGLSIEQKEHEEEGDQNQAGAAGLSAEHKEHGEKEQDPTGLPTAQIQAGSVSAQNKDAELNWQAISSEQLESLHEKLASFLVKEEDEAELRKIAHILYAEDKRRGKMIAELEIKLNGIAMGSSAEAEKRRAGPENEDGSKQHHWSSEEAIKFQLSGQRLVEIFSIHTNCPFIKSISIYDDRCGKTIYKSSGDVDIINFLEERDIWLLNHPGRDSSDYMGELVVTGPGRAMSALPGFIIEVDVGDENGVFDLSWCWEDRTVVDKPIVQSIFTSRGDVHVTAAVMSNALQAYVKFLFSPPESSKHFPQLYVAGTLVLQIESFPVGIKIFKSCWDDPACLRQQTSNKGMTSYELPLTRHVFTLPVGYGVRVTGALALHVGRGSGLGFHVSVDQSIEFKGQVGSCRWQLGHLGPSSPFSDASICINAIYPF